MPKTHVVPGVNEMKNWNPPQYFKPTREPLEGASPCNPHHPWTVGVISVKDPGKQKQRYINSSAQLAPSRCALLWTLLPSFQHGTIHSGHEGETKSFDEWRTKDNKCYLPKPSNLNCDWKPQQSSISGRSCTLHCWWEARCGCALQWLRLSLVMPP